MIERLFSVWDRDERVYRYYVAPVAGGAEDAPARARASPRQRPPLGDAPERLLRELPRSARYVGSGVLARGEIAVLAAAGRGG